MTPKKDEKATLLHQLRNALNPIYTFLEMVDTSAEEEKVQTFHANCKHHFQEVLKVIKKLEGM